MTANERLRDTVARAIIGDGVLDTFTVQYANDKADAILRAVWEAVSDIVYDEDTAEFKRLRALFCPSEGGRG